MGDHHPVFFIKLPVVSRSGQGAVVHANNHLQLLTRYHVTVLGTVHADPPEITFAVHPSCSDLSTDLHHIVLAAQSLQVGSDHIHRVTLGNGIYIQFHIGVRFMNLLSHQGYLIHPHILKQAVDHGTIQFLLLTRAKTPGVNQWGQGYIKRSSGDLVYPSGLTKHSSEHGIGLYTQFIPVNCTDDTDAIVRGE